MSKTVGVDAQELGDSYRSVLSTALRTDPSVLVICNAGLDTGDYQFASRAFQAGHSVHLIDKRELAPPDTQWLTQPVQ